MDAYRVWLASTDDAQWDATERMIGMGGSFARAIAEAWRVADLRNRATLTKAFAELFVRYLT